MRKWYNVIFAILRPLAAILYPMRVERRGEIPAGSAIICANHSSFIDPVLVALAFGAKEHFLHFMVKMELAKIPIVGAILLKMGSFFVDRSFGSDAIRITMKLLKNQEKVMMFPEGTRVSQDDSIAAKSGAVRLAMKMDAPLVPVFIPRDKRIFRRVKLVIGEPYTIEKQSGSDNEELSNELMGKIKSLGAEEE